MKFPWKSMVPFALAASTLMAGCSANKPTINWDRGIFYEIYVGSFADSNKDNVGDLNGLTQKLDYLNDGKSSTDGDLQINGLWLMPINPSPSYHKYDVTDYYNVDPKYGTLEDFKKLTEEAHKRGVKVILDLVVNHTSDKHPWFVSASTDPNSPYRDYYVWAKPDTNIHERGPWGEQVWFPSGGDYYYSTFYSGMPDLNFDNPKVREEMIKVGQFWLKQGADGFRLDAALHIYPKKEEPKNHVWWAEFRQAMEKVNPNVYLAGEVWDSNSVMAPYYKELNSTFNFDVAAKIVGAVNAGTDNGIATSLERVHELYAKNNPKFIDAPFLTNHDQNRVMSLLQGKVDKAKVAASILLTLPGNPFLYYGEEIGMLGAKPDEYIREPFRWYPGDGDLQTKWEIPRYNRPDNAVSVLKETDDPNSLLSHYRKMIRVRQAHEALMNGTINSISVKNGRLISFARSAKDEQLIVIHNVSNQPQTAVLEGKLAKTTDIVFSTDDGAEVVENNGIKQLVLAPYSTVILK